MNGKPGLFYICILIFIFPLALFNQLILFSIKRTGQKYDRTAAAKSTYFINLYYLLHSCPLSLSAFALALT